MLQNGPLLPSEELEVGSQLLLLSSRMVAVLKRGISLLIRDYVGADFAVRYAVRVPEARAVHPADKGTVAIVVEAVFRGGTGLSCTRGTAQALHQCRHRGSVW